MTRLVIGIITLVFGLASIVAFSFQKKSKNSKDTKSGVYQISAKWELPEELEEVSGIEIMQDGRLACIQDEEGILFIYDLKSEKIDRTIEFGEHGDYEGICIHNQDAYVLRSDGVIFELKNFQTDVKVSKYSSGMKNSVNFEGICVGKTGNRLLLIMKEKKEDDDFRNVYAFDLHSKKFSNQPIKRLDLQNDIYEDHKGGFHPSEIKIHPKNGNFYILDGRHPALLILNDKFKPQSLQELDKDNFAQPEGLAFSPSGQLFISNEADQNDANILQVQLKITKP